MNTVVRVLPFIYRIPTYRRLLPTLPSLRRRTAVMIVLVWVQGGACNMRNVVVCGAYAVSQRHMDIVGCAVGNDGSSGVVLWRRRHYATAIRAARRSARHQPYRASTFLLFILQHYLPFYA